MSIFFQISIFLTIFLDMSIRISENRLAEAESAAGTKKLAAVHLSKFLSQLQKKTLLLQRKVTLCGRLFCTRDESAGIRRERRAGKGELLSNKAGGNTGRHEEGNTGTKDEEEGRETGGETDRGKET